MFENIAGKMKGLATVLAVIGIIGSVWAGLIMMDYYGEPMIVQGLFVIIVGCLASWLGSLILYGFGELIVSVRELNSCVAEIQRIQQEKLIHEQRKAESTNNEEAKAE